MPVVSASDSPTIGQTTYVAGEQGMDWATERHEGFRANVGEEGDC